MTRTDEHTIEAEVVEIDGVAVMPRPSTPERKWGSRVDWRGWQGKIKTLDSRWWPLWLVLGAVFLVLVVAVGMCAAVLLLCYKLLMVCVHAFLSLFSTPTHIRPR